MKGRFTTYQELFNKVYAKRLVFVNNIIVIISIVCSLALALPYGNFWWTLFLTLIIRGPAIFGGLFAIRLLRASNVSVNYSFHKTLASQIYHCVASKWFLWTLAGYGTSVMILAWTYLSQLPLLGQYYVISKDYQVKDSANDEWVYFWCYSSFVAVVYTCQQLVFERNTLKFTYGISKSDPKSSLFHGIPQLVGNAVVMNSLAVVVFPVIYMAFRSVFYKLFKIPMIIMALDSKMPKFGLTLKNWCNFGYFSFIVVFGWELVNHTFNVYSTIGCLDGKKPISTYSSDPINTLLSGLRNSDPSHELSKLSAFQELAYISTLSDSEGIKLRTAIYNAHSKTGFIWQAILDECTLVIKQTTQRINYRSRSDASILQKSQIQIKEEIKDKNDIFGNSFVASPDKTLDGLQSYTELINKQQKPQTPPKKTNQDKYFELLEKSIFGPFKKVVDSLFSENDTQSLVIHKLKPIVKELVTVYNTYRTNFLSTWIGIFFRVSLKRDTESRVLNPVNYGNAVISLTNLLVHAIEEDKNFSITNHHISDTLNLIEKPIRSCAKYVEALPPSVFLTLQQKKQDVVKSGHLISLVYELTLFNFRQLCIAYNFKLNDLFLSATCFKLAKRVIDEEIASRQK